MLKYRALQNPIREFFRAANAAAQRSAHAHSTQKGFTLIEIMAVVLIIGMLTTLVGFAVFKQIDKARVSTARAQMKNIETTLEFYRMDNSRYPTTEQGLNALIQKPTSEPIPRNYREGGYLRGDAVPKDPWQEPYQYTSEHSDEFQLWSLGSDNQPGGEGTARDIYAGEVASDAENPE